MKRRAVLASLAALSGCSSWTSPGDDGPSSPSRGPATPTDTEPSPTPTETEPSPTPTDDVATDRPTYSRPPCVDGGETRYALGEAHEVAFYRIVVTDVELLTTLEFDDGTTEDLPEDEQLALATTTVENRSDEEAVWAVGNRWGFVAAPCDLYEPQFDIYQGQRSRSLYVDRLQQVDHQKQWGPDGYHLGAGEHGNVWYAAVVPRSLTLAEFEVGFRWDYDPFRVRWVPE